MKVLVAGDFCPQARVKKLLENGDYASVLSEVRLETEKTDFSIVNFECPIISSDAHPIPKCGPNLSCGLWGLDAIQWAGFDCITFANNHFYDYGDDGVISSLNACERIGMRYVGGGNSLKDASRTLYFPYDRIKLAVINCCEREFSHATEFSGGANPLNPVSQYYAIKEAKENASFVIVVVHGGKEHIQIPSPRMQQIYRFFIDAGADAVVNHHQHCYSGYEIYHDRAIFYGLGNLCFDNPHYRNNKWNYGYMAVIDTEEPSKISLIPYIQCNTEPTVHLISYNDFYKEIELLNGIISSPDVLTKQYGSQLASSRKYYKSFFTPYSNRYLKGLYNRNLLPSFLTEKRKRALYNYIACESHIDFVLDMLKH